jgi:hypothetical protein
MLNNDNDNDNDNLTLVAAVFNETLMSDATMDIMEEAHREEAFDVLSLVHTLSNGMTYRDSQLYRSDILGILTASLTMKMRGRDFSSKVLAHLLVEAAMSRVSGVVCYVVL